MSVNEDLPFLPFSFLFSFNSVFCTHFLPQSPPFFSFFFFFFSLIAWVRTLWERRLINLFIVVVCGYSLLNLCSPTREINWHSNPSYLSLSVCLCVLCFQLLPAGSLINSVCVCVCYLELHELSEMLIPDTQSCVLACLQSVPGI